MRFSLFSCSVVAVALSTLFPCAASAQGQFAVVNHSPDVMQTLQFSQTGQTQSISLSIGSNQVMNLDSLTVSPSSAQSGVLNSMKVYNANGQVIQSGPTNQIPGGTDANSTPVRMDFTSNVNGAVSLSLGTRTVQAEGLFNSGSSDSTTAPMIYTASFAVSGCLTTNSQQASPPTRQFKIHLKPGQRLEITAGTASTTSAGGYEGTLSCYCTPVGGSKNSPFFSVDVDLYPHFYFRSNMTNYYPFDPSIEGDYILCVQLSGGGGAGPISTSYSFNFKTSLATQAPGHGGHPAHPNKKVRANPVAGAAPGGCPGGCGPVSGDPVDLSTGQENFDSPADLTVYNPSGPDVQFTRHYSNDRALSLSSSPGMATGWFESYDVHLESNSDGTHWPSMDLVYPNGARETMKPQVDSNGNLVLDGNGQAQFSTPTGSTYLMTAVPNTGNKTYNSARVLWSDGAAWNFQTPSANSNKALLYSIEAATSSSGTPQGLLFQWVGDDRDDFHLVAVLNALDSKTLLSLSYTGNPASGYLLSQINDCYGRSVVYSNGTLAGATNVSTLTGVSTILPSGSTQGLARYMFGYANFSGSPMLSSVAVPYPNDATQTATATINYGADGRVSTVVDGVGNSTAFTYGSSQTLVQTLNSARTVETQYTAKFDAEGHDLGTIDAANNQTYISYDNSNNPDLPTSVQDAAGRTTRVVYEPNGFGLVNAITTPRGVTTHYGYNYGVWPFGLLMQTWQSTGSGTTLVNHPSTTITYLQGYERAGLIYQVTSPHPNVGVSGWTGPTTVSSYFTYNAFGDVTSVTTPGHNGYGSLSASLSYTTDGTYSQAAQRGQVVSVTDAAGQVSGFRYDTRGNQVSSRDALGNVSSTTFDLADNPTSQTMPPTGQTGSGASSVTFAYSYLGGSLKTTNSFDESGSATPFRSVTTNYDAEGRTVSVGGATEPVSYTYTSFNAPKTLSDGNGNTTTYSYDTRGLLRQIVRPGGNTASGSDVVKFTSYAPDGQLLSETDGRGKTTTFAHTDPDGLTNQITLPDETITLTRDSWGRLTGRSDASGSQTYGYSDADALMSTTTNYKRADGTLLPPLVLNNVYEADGARSGLSGPSGTATSAINLNYSFDQRGGLTGLVDNAQNIASGWSYDAKERLASASQPNGWSRSYAFNALDQVLGVSHFNPNVGSLNFGDPSNSAQQLLYDGAGNMVRETATASGTVPSTVAGTTSYGYDGGDRLTGESSDRFGSYNRSYALDAAFNRTGATGSNGQNPSWSRTLTGNNNNQVAGSTFGTTSSTSYTYDGEGNRASLTSGNTVTTYAYDAQQRLAQVSQSVSGATATVTMKAGYSSDGLRAWKENSQGVRTYFLYDGDQLVGEFDSSGVMQASQTWGVEGLSYRRTASGASAGNRFYLWDVRGNVAVTTDANGNVINTPSSDGFSSSGGTEPCATFGGQVGGYRDNETGLILFGQRYYDPNLGSWLTRDPIAESGGINLYSYVGGNPVGHVDPSGLVEVQVWARSVGITNSIRTPGDHTFILVWETDRQGHRLPNQTPYIFAAYNHDAHGVKDGYMYVFGGKLSSWFDDYHYLPGQKFAGCSHGVIWSRTDTNTSKLQVFRSLRRVADKINDYHPNYNFLGTTAPNSNSAVFGMIKLGLGIDIPDWRLPGNIPGRRTSPFFPQ